MPIATRLAMTFLSIILLSSTIFTLVGVRIIDDRITAEAQERVRTDLNSAREIYRVELERVTTAAKFTAARLFVFDILRGDTSNEFLAELARFKNSEGLDLLTITDAHGRVVLRVNYPAHRGDDQSEDEVVAEVIRTARTAASTTVVDAAELLRESPLLAEQAHIVFRQTPMARQREETEETAGMMLKAAAPVLDDAGSLAGIVYAAVLLNHNYAIVDKIKQTVFQGVVYEGKDIGTATIFQDDVRISTNVRYETGERAIGTRIAGDVYEQVVLKQQPWIGRAYVVNDWYITAYEPIRDLDDTTIGVLYVGILEQKYADIQNRMVLVFVGITLAGAVVSTSIALLVAGGISRSIRKLVSASEQLANGNLDAKVDVSTGDELGKLAYRFNQMASALRDRDERLKEFTKKKIMESERLAMIGQLSANVAHEMNNPLQGIVTYSNLLLERELPDDMIRENVSKIATQANRCREIIRGLLDFARQKKPDQTLANVNSLLRGCVSLVKDQALFHNITIVENLDESVPMVVVDPAQIERVFLNLIINAAEAMEGRGSLRLTSMMNPRTRCVEIEVKDTGHGISEENMERIFDPFFTTKETGHGVGLGLAISYGIVKEHKGDIAVESEPGQGSAFTISLPFPVRGEPHHGD